MCEVEQNEFTVEYWRLEFSRLKENLGRDWMVRLGEYDPYFSTAQGKDMLLLVRSKRASLERTQKVVGAIQMMLKKQKPKRALSKRQKLAMPK